MKHLICLLSLLMVFSFVYAEEEKVDATPKEKLEFPSALAKATKENKSVLLVFSDLDGCPPCQVLEKTVFATPDFKSFADKNLVFLDMDFSESKMGGTPEFQKLFAEYGIEVTPTILLTDNTGLPYQRLQYDGQTKEVFISEIGKALKKRELKTKFLVAKDESEKKKLAAEFTLARSDGENFIFFADLIAFGLLNDKDLKVEDKIKQLGELYIYSKDDVFVEKLGAEIKKIDPEKKFGSERLFVIKEFIALIMAKNDDKAFAFFLKNKANFKGDDLGYIYQFGMQLNEAGKTDKTIEILTFILADEDIKKNEDAVKQLTEQMNSLKKVKEVKTAVEGTPTIKLNEEPVKKTEEPKGSEKPKVEEKPKEKVEEKAIEKNKVEEKVVPEEKMK